jgi:ferredoxin
MYFVVDLKTCQNHGQCAYVSKAFPLNDEGKLAFRSHAKDVYRSADLDELDRDDVEEAADACPVQAIEIRD